MVRSEMSFLTEDDVVLYEMSEEWRARKLKDKVAIDVPRKYIARWKRRIYKVNIVLNLMYFTSPT